MRHHLIKTILAGILLAGLSGGSPQAEREQKLGESHALGEALYLASANHFVKVDLKTNTAKMWGLLTAAGLEDSPDCAGRHVPISCDWHATETRLDLKSKRMYFVTARESPGDEPESDEEETVPRKFVVWAVGLADLKPLKKIEVPFPQSRLPTIILTRDGKELLMSHQDEDGKTRDVDTIDTATWTKISTVRDNSGNVLDTYFPAEAYFAPSGGFIANGNTRIRMEGGQFHVEDFDPRTKLAMADVKKLSGFETTDKDGHKFLSMMVAGSVNGKTLEWVPNDAETETCFWTVDMETGETSPAVVAKKFSEAKMIGDGKEFALFEVHIRPETPHEGPGFLSTGRVSVYRVDSGALAKEFNIPEIRGEGEMLCTSGDGTLAAYRHGKKLMILNLQTGGVTRVAGTFADFTFPGYQGACAFGE